MYRGYTLNYTNSDIDDYLIGNSIKKRINEKIEESIESFKTGGYIDGSKLSSDWFPEIESDIFISHSHKDENFAISLCGWLWKHFQITGFVDSLVWGKYTSLLREIDNEYCIIPGTKSYSYEKRNFSTSHVHMMLSTALTRMIDNTECLFFLNTKNSITLNDVLKDDGTTISPWIYTELEISKLIRKRSKRDHRLEPLTESVQKSLPAIPIRYNVELSHLGKLTGSKLNEWKSLPSTNNKNALDNLYRITERINT